MADWDGGLSGLFGSGNGNGSAEPDEWCYDYDRCHFPYVSIKPESNLLLSLQPRSLVLTCVQQKACPVSDLHENARYTEGSAAWVLIASIIVFFMVLIYIRIM